MTQNEQVCPMCSGRGTLTVAGTHILYASSLGRIGTTEDEIALTPVEHMILSRLADQQPQRVSVRNLCDFIDFSPSSLRVHIHRIRKKLGEGMLRIEGRHGRGYGLSGGWVLRSC